MKQLSQAQHYNKKKYHSAYQNINAAQYPTQLKVKGYPCHYRPWSQLHDLITAYGCTYGLPAVCVVAKDIVKRKAYFISLAPV